MLAALVPPFCICLVASTVGFARMAALTGNFSFWIQGFLAPASSAPLRPKEVLHIDGFAQVLAALDVVVHFGKPICARGIRVNDNC